MVYGSGNFIYEEVHNWAQFPPDWQVRDISGVTVDAQDRVYALRRGFDPVTLFESDGTLIRAWGGDLFTRAHSICIGPDDSVYCVDDMGHRVFKFTPDGELLLTIASQNQHTDDVQLTARGQVVEHVYPPFNFPTDVALSPEGDLYITDGYGNACVHKFAADGTLLFSWGSFGSDPGQFYLPHGVVVDDEGLVYVSDRMNQRVQVFTPEGKFLAQWTDVRWPDNACLDSAGNIYVAELGALFLNGCPADLSQPPGRVTVRDKQGDILAAWGMIDPLGEGRFFAPHAITVDSQGSIYIGETAVTYSRSTAPANWPMLRKFKRV